MIKNIVRNIKTLIWQLEKKNYDGLSFAHKEGRLGTRQFEDTRSWKKGRTF
jgi:beta-lactamase class A